MKNAIEPKALATMDMSQAAPVSTPTTIKYMDNVCYQVSWSNSGSAIGTLDVQLSQDGTNWSNMGLNVALNNNSPQLIDVNQTGAAMSRLIYTKTSGTGTLTPVVSAKGI